MNRKSARFIYPLLAVLIAGADYGWSLWYYGSLFHGNQLLSAAEVTTGNLRQMLCQHVLVSLPVILFSLAFLIALRSSFASQMGLTIGKKRDRLSIGVMGSVYLAMLVAALLMGGITQLSAVYQWVYYLLFVAFTEELVFRGMLPWLIEKSGLPKWCVWVIPGILFAVMHTLIPVIKFGGSAGSFLMQLLSCLGGYTLGGCIFYSFRRWSGTLWLPVLIHATLDFAGTWI